MLAQEYRHEFKLHTTPKGRVIPKITASGRHTGDSGCTGWPTTSAHDSQEQGKGREMTATGRIKTHTGSDVSANLPRVAALAGHPTPNCPTGGPNSNRENRGAGGADLEEIANLAGHPTCSARDWKDTPGMAQTGTNPDGTERSRLDMLPRVSVLAGHATPRVTTNSGCGNPTRACDGKSRLEDQCLGANTASTATSTAKTVGYRLNPGFSLWLMIGIPTIVDAWASCGELAMQSCRRSRRSS